MIKKILKSWFPSVKYWKTKDTERAFVTLRNGYFQMKIDGEDYLYPGFPRGHLLSSVLTKLKHTAKNRFFNETWDELENKVPENEIFKRLKSVIDELNNIIGEYRHYLIDPEKFVPAVREVWRAMTEIEKILPYEKREKLHNFKKVLTFILQEDDAYRFRVQFLAKFFNPNSWWVYDPIKNFENSLILLEHAETLEDMKLRIRLLRRILVFILKDETIKKLFYALCKEVDWKKLRLSKADKYYFRAKWFKADYANPNTFWGRIQNKILT